MDAKRDAEFEAEISLFEDHNADIPEPNFSAQITQLSRWRNQARVLKKSVTVVPTLRKSRAAEMERLELEESTVVKIRDRTQNAHKICNPRGACGSQNQQFTDKENGEWFNSVPGHHHSKGLGRFRTLSPGLQRP
jgi:hypothetical protein